MELNYNIGAGNTTIEGFQNLDWGDDVFLSKVPDNSCDMIYSSHFLEYFDEPQAMYFLSGWFGKLKKGGKLYLAVPDIAGIIQVYNDTDVILTGPLFGKMESAGGDIFHKSCYDEPKLRAYLLAANFKHIFRHHPTGDTWITTGDDSSSMYRDTMISLNLSCEK